MESFQTVPNISRYMGNNGKSAKRSLQDVDVPVLDSLVREGIQNSLDAAKDGADKVIVNFNSGYFDNDSFLKELGDIGEKSFAKFGEYREFISLGDKNTIGLVGNKDGQKDWHDSTRNNLRKLVFEMTEPQEKEGSGGSWGLGKTVFYTLSKAGLVIYYSRINENGFFKNRLIGVLMEDPDPSKDPLCSNNPDYTGIAFLGERGDGGKVNAIEDDNFINKVLNTFGLRPYTGEDTGTTVIVPFIDSSYLLSSFNNADEEEDRLPWYYSLNKALRLLMLKWFFPRLSFNSYPKLFDGEINKPYLEAYINNNKVEINPVEEPVFSMLSRIFDDIAEKKADERVKVIRITRERDLDNNILGWLGLMWCTPKELGITGYTTNGVTLPEPYSFLELNNQDDQEKNHPIVCYMRSPGMINKYYLCSNNMPKDKYLFGLFVLNSTNKIRSNNLSLEEYVRQGEKSDHFEWSDHILKVGSKRNIIGRMFLSISGQINEFVNPSQQNQMDNEDPNLEWSHDPLLNSWLPAIGLGKRPNLPLDSGSSSSNKLHVKKAFNIDTSSFPNFTKDGIDKELLVESSEKFVGFRIDLGVISFDKKAVPIYKLEELGLPEVCTINSAFINIEEVDKGHRENSNEFIKIDLNSPSGSLLGGALSYQLKMRGKITYGIRFINDSIDPITFIKMKLKLSITLFDRNTAIAYLTRLENSNEQL